VNHRPAWIRAVIGANVAFLLMAGPWPIALKQPGSASYIARVVKGDDRLATLAARIPADAGVAGDAFALTTLSHRRDVYLWPSPFRDAPADQLPSGLATPADPVKAARVSYLLITTNHADGIPADFTRQAELDGVVLYARNARGR
jgi:hypothetical protein